MLRTAIYIRRSSEDDEKQIHSLDRQAEELNTFLDRYNNSCDSSEQLIYDPDKDIYKES